MYNHISVSQGRNMMSSMSSNEVHEYWREFIEIYKSFPALWKVKSEEYKNRKLKDDCYKILVKKLKEIEPDADRYAVRRKVNILRSNFRRELNKVLASKSYKTTLWYYEDMQFLSNHVSECEEHAAEIDAFDNTQIGTFVDSYDDIESTTKSDSFNGNSAIKTFPKAYDKMGQKTEDDIEIQGKVWASEFRKLNTEQQLFAKKAIDDILFEGRLTGLNRFSVQINGTYNNT